MMRRAYTQPELEMRKIISAQAISAGDGKSSDDNEIDAGEVWPDF